MSYILNLYPNTYISNRRGKIFFYWFDLKWKKFWVPVPVPWVGAGAGTGAGVGAAGSKNAAPGAGAGAGAEKK